VEFSGDRLFVAITSEHRILAVDLGKPGRNDEAPLHVSQYARAGINAPADFSMPDNLAVDRQGNLYITEDPGGNFAGGKRNGDDIWVAAPSTGGKYAPAAGVVRFASLSDCDAEPTGIYFDISGNRLFVNVQHRGGDMQDKTMAIFPARTSR
jgi:hypothetical protein